MIANLKKNKKKGFTLVELIVVIAIIAIIAAVAVPTTISYVNKAKVSTADQEANELMNALNTAMTDLAIEGEVTGATFAAKLDECMPDAKNVNKVKVAVSGNEVTITVFTNVESEDYSDIEGNDDGVVCVQKKFDFSSLGITANNIDGVYQYSAGSWSNPNASAGEDTGA